LLESISRVLNKILEMWLLISFTTSEEWLAFEPISFSARTLTTLL
jgi:hypothetical protein